VIYDLDAGRPERPTRSSVRMTVLTIGVVCVALAFFAVLAFGPGQRASQTPILTLSAPALPTMARPTFNTRPVPDRTLVLSGDDAISVHRGLGPDDILLCVGGGAAGGHSAFFPSWSRGRSVPFVTKEVPA